MKIRERALKLKNYELKQPVIPDGLVLVVDTREQLPLFGQGSVFNSLVDTISDTVINGDYTIKGFEDKFAIERKQISDFYTYIGKERKRTVKKLERLAQLNFAALVIEASLDDLFIPQLYSSVSPEVARGFLVSVNIRYGIHVYTNRSREKIERWILDRAIKFYKLQRNGE